MNIDTLNAISPVDGRYGVALAPLRNYFSEKALISYRIRVETEYFHALCKIPLPQLKGVHAEMLKISDQIYKHLTESDFIRAKEIENTTNHDVKAVEYLLREKFSDTPLKSYIEFIHFGLTSQDINNTAMPMMVKDALKDVLIPVLDEMMEILFRLSEEWRDIPILAYTHGQPASPTHLGKETYVFYDRLKPLVSELKGFKHSGKFGGATGNFNAHKAAYPDIDWITFADKFLANHLGLTRQRVTTQIEHYDGWASLFNLVSRINTILIDLSRDIWSYVSMNVFGQKVKAGEVGSSAMPHKVNPINFENGEGNLGLANAIFGHLASKLPISRLQRDLTDSTVSRAVGLPFAHTLLAWQNIIKGLEKLTVNKAHIREILDHHWVILAEPIQTILRREGVENPYELLKNLTRGTGVVTKSDLHNFIDTLEVSDGVKDELKQLAPDTYTGYTHVELTKGSSQ